MFLDHQISFLEWFLKDHVTLKTGVMTLKIQLLFLNYSFYGLFDQMHKALVNLRDFFQNILSYILPTQYWTFETWHL